MSASGGFLVPDELAYPRELGPYTDPNKEPEGFLVRMFRPKLIPYPLPQGLRVPGSVTTVPIAATRPASSITAAVSPAGAAPTLLRAYSFNPAFSSVLAGRRLADLTESDLSELAFKWSTKDGSSVAFVVPEGFDAVSLLFGGIEVNPSVGSEQDLKLLVSAGEAKIGPNVCGTDKLVPGSQLLVTVPWRAGGLVDLAAQHLRVLVHAHFYRSADAPLCRV